jgi:hypothetical protein
MKIINLEQFLAMPSETVFMSFSPCVFGDLRVKMDNCGENDFIFKELVTIDVDNSGQYCDKLFDAMDNGTALRLDFNATERDGLFDPDQKFAVLEKEDIVGIIKVLSECL